MASGRHLPKMDPLVGMLDLFSTSLQVPFVFLALELFFLEDVSGFCCFYLRCPNRWTNPGFIQRVGTKLSWSTS